MREYCELSAARQLPDGVLDPFAERAPWFISVGRAYVRLDNLLHGLPLEHEVRVCVCVCVCVCLG
jgi:hypothetical protein